MITANENIVSAILTKSITDFDIGNYGQIIGKSVIAWYTIIGVITMSELFETAIVEKRNVLNELRSNNMMVQELRFFSIYLAKINPRDKSTRVVRFPIEDFQRIMGFGRLNFNQLKESTNRLLGKSFGFQTSAAAFSLSLCLSVVGYLVMITTNGSLR